MNLRNARCNDKDISKCCVFVGTGIIFTYKYTEYESYKFDYSVHNLKKLRWLDQKTYMCKKYVQGFGEET